MRNGTRLLCKMQSEERNDGRKRSDYEERKEGYEREMPFMQHKYVLHSPKEVKNIYLE